MGKVVFHVVLPTRTKMFCGCPIVYDEEGYRMESSQHLCPVCRGEKGAYPILNKKAVEEAIAVVLALNATVTQYNLFDRARGEDGLYSVITQYSYPIGKDGYVEFECGDAGSRETSDQNLSGSESTDQIRIGITVIRLMESEEEKGIPVLEIVSDRIEEEQNPYYIEEIEKVLLALGMEEWEIIETDDVIETMESQKALSYLPDPDLPPVIISQWWIDQIAAKYPDLIHMEEPEAEDEDDF